MKIVTAAQMQTLDRRTIREGGIPSLVLMERAGTAVVGAMASRYGDLTGKRVTIVCGKGHNGGDGFVVARLLSKRRAQVRVLLFHPITDLVSDSKTMYRRLLRTAGGRTTVAGASPKQLAGSLAWSDLVVDALLGTGLSSPVTGTYGTVIDLLNQAGRPIVAVDLPSGLQTDTGHVLGHTVRADLTVTFGLPKLGLYLNEGIDHAGEVRIADIGIPGDYVDAVPAPLSLLTAETVARLLPIRRPSSHKGTFGHAGIIAGSPGKTGAAALAAKAALRTGAGLVTVATPRGVNDVLESKLLEVMTYPVPDTADRTFSVNALDLISGFVAARTAVAIGPGLSTHPETVELIHRLLGLIEKPCVLDADALNAVADRPESLLRCRAPLILTPHPGEMARLVKVDNAQAVNRDRISVASSFAAAHGSLVVLKGARTLLADEGGRLAICPTGNPGLATAGTGDVLTGMIVSLVAQGLSPWDAACSASYLHGLAGDLAAQVHGQAGMIAGDVIDQIPYAIGQLSHIS
ncbi:MAG: NAD(P)H-hydrate dehydratase [Nitrospiraceae bacterium]